MEDLKPGNIILFDHKESRNPPEATIRGLVRHAHTEDVEFTGGLKRKYNQLGGIELTHGWVRKFGFSQVGDVWTHCDHAEFIIKPGQFKFVHQLQNYFFDKVGEMLEIKKQP